MPASARSLFLDSLVRRYGMNKVAFCGIDYVK